MAKIRTWDNWATVEELSILWKLSKRRTQQVVKEYSDDFLVNKAVLVEWDTDRPYAKPIYFLVKDRI